MATEPPLVVIAGPTASGKTSLAIKLAKKFGGEIISADYLSWSYYRNGEASRGRDGGRRTLGYRFG